MLPRLTASPDKSMARGLLVPVLVLLLGAALRIAPLTDNRFHADEALYASYGRLISTGDWNLATRLVDKPPLSFYLMAGSFMRIGPNEVAARLPALAASLISMALLWRLALKLWQETGLALLAMLFHALSPLPVLFAPTAFTDPLLTMWLLAALVAVSGGRWGWGGLFVALALATKQTALFFIPFVLGMGVMTTIKSTAARRPHPRRDRYRVRHDGWLPPPLRIAERGIEGVRLTRFAIPILTVVALLVAWDATRGPVDGFWRAGVAANNPERLARIDEVWPRFRDWLDWLRYIGGWAGANLLIVGALMLLAICRFRGFLHFRPLSRKRERGAAGQDIWRNSVLCGVRVKQVNKQRFDMGLLVFIVFYLMTYWLVAFNIYDRYLLPLVPLIALLVARAITLIVPRRTTLVAAGLSVLMLWPGLRAAQSWYPVGGDRGAYDGIDAVAAYLDELPSGTVIYDHWLGWPLDFYLFDSPAYTTYFATPDELTAMLKANPDEQAVLLLPGWVAHDDVLAAVSGAGYTVRPSLETVSRTGEPSLLVLEITP